MTFAEAKERVERAWSFPYRGLTLDDVEPTTTPGYWQKKEPCGGWGECASPLHGCTFNSGPIQHTVTFSEPGARDERGRFVSPFRAWRVLTAHPDPQEGTK